jgi:hypothetical protein
MTNRRPAFTDFTSNLITQELASPTELWRHFLRERALPRRLMPLFLHEINHHWFFHTSVGTAITLLRQAAVDKLLETEALTRSDAEAAILRYFRYCAARRVFESLLEGAALFHEFLARPGGSNTISIPSSMGLVLFVPPKNRQFTDTLRVNAAWKDAVKEYRLSDQALEDKTRLLECPLAGDGRGTYLRGYLMVCNLFYLGKRLSPVLADHEMFLMFIRSLVFQDPGMVALILEEEFCLDTWCERILTRLQRRLALCSDERLDKEARRLEKSIEEGNWTGVEVFASDEDFTRRDELLRARGLITSPDGMTEVKLTWNDGSADLFGRWPVRLAVEHGNLDVDPTGALHLSNEVGRCSLGRIQERTVIEGEKGFCGLYLFQEPFKNILYLVSTHSRPLIAEFAEKIDSADGHWLVRLIMRQQLRALAEEGTDDMLYPLLTEYIFGEETLRDMLDEWARRAEQYEHSVALGSMSSAFMASWSQAMGRTGFAGLFRDRRHVRGLALLGLLSSVETGPESIESRMASDGFDYSRERAFLDQLTRDSGFPLIDSSPPTLECTPNARTMVLV